MKKKQYDKPSMEEVAMEQDSMLLAVSNGVDSLDSFIPGGDPLNQSAPELDLLNPMDE